jgi:hypothetical protein
VSKKLGQTLIDRGAITADELECALRNQLMLGGHLGTCLLELGLIDEEILGTTLAETLRVSYARPQDLLRAEEIAVRSLSKHLVEEYEAVPFRRSGKSLDVAMINPRDLPAIDALAFASTCKIVPWVAPEIRIFEAMERLYDIPRRMRYIVISRALTPTGAAIARDVNRQNSESKPASQPEPNPRSTYSDQGAEYGYGRSWIEIADELAAKSVPHGDAPGNDVNSLASQLCRVNDKDEIAHAVLAHALKTMKRAMLFAVKGDDLALWDSAGFDAKLDAAAFGTIGIRSLAILDHLLGHDHYRGPLGDSAEHREIYTRLNVPAPVNILLVPIHINDRLVALFLGDGGPEGQDLGDAREGLRLARMLGLALNVVIFKKKIRSLGSLAGHSPS